MLNRNDITMYDNIQITAKDTQFAQKYTINIEDEFLRKKLFYTLSLTSSLKNVLNNNDISFDIDNSLFQILQVIENYEYVDAYSKKLPIQIAYTFENDTTVALPKIHFEASIEPKMYLVARLHSNLTSFDLIGSINTNFLNKVNENNKYIYVDATSLNSINNLKTDIDKFLEDFEIVENCEIFNHVKTNFISFIDKNLTVTENVDLIKHLLKCPKCRKELLYYYKFETMVRNDKYENNLVGEIDKFINNPDYSPIDNEIELNQIENNILQDKIQDEIQNQNVAEKNINIQEKGSIDNHQKEEEYKEFSIENHNSVYNVDKNVKDENANNKSSSSFEDNSKLNLLYDESLTIKENINEIETNYTPRNSKLKKIFIFSIISALIIGIACYSSYKNQNKEDLSNSHIVESIPPESVNSQNDKTSEVQVARPLKLSQISWEAPEVVLKTPVYNKYLIDVGKNLKVNLQNKFIELKEIVYQTKFQLQILIDTDGSVADIKIIQASGNKSVDELIISTTRQTLNYIKPPIVETIKEPLILILEFEF